MTLKQVVSNIGNTFISALTKKQIKAMHGIAENIRKQKGVKNG